MNRSSEVAGTYVGRLVVDADGRRLGRVVGVIHRASGVDVLVDARLWLRHRVHRVSIEDLVPSADDRLFVAGSRSVRRPAATGVPAAATAGSADRSDSRGVRR